MARRGRKAKQKLSAASKQSPEEPSTATTEVNVKDSAAKSENSERKEAVQPKSALVDVESAHLADAEKAQTEAPSSPPSTTGQNDTDDHKSSTGSRASSLSPTDTSNDDDNDIQSAQVKAEPKAPEIATVDSQKPSVAPIQPLKKSEKSLADMKADVKIMSEEQEPSTTACVSPPIPPKRSKQTQPKQTKTRPAKARKPKAQPESHLITEYFEVRRSTRKPEKLIQKEKEEQLHEMILREEELDLDIVMHPVKGRGIHAGRAFVRGEFVVEYRGDLIDPKTAREREKQYADESNTGCYSYYFECNGRQWCVDATRESPYLGRLVNHSSKKPNLKTQAVAIDGTPHLILVANRDIGRGEELLYNYGDRSKEAIAANPWLVDT